MGAIPIHNLEAKSLKRMDFDVIPLNQKSNYEGTVPHRHDFYELMLFTEGGGLHEIDFREYNIEKHSLHFVSPTQVHRLKSTTARGYVICFREEMFSLGPGHAFTDVFKFYDFTLYAPVMEPGSEFFEILKDIAVQLHTGLDAASPLKREIASAWLNIILLKIKEYFLQHCVNNTIQTGTAHPKIIHFKKLIDDNYINHYTAFQYAELLNISGTYLNALAKKETGRTATELIHERLLLESKRLLYSTHLSVKEISNLLHFESVAYFIRFFKKNIGQTPLDYRNSLLP